MKQSDARHVRAMVDQCVDDDDLLGVVEDAGDSADEDFGDLHGLWVSDKPRECASGGGEARCRRPRRGASGT